MMTVVEEKYNRLSSDMNEKLRRRWAACEAMAIGRGGISEVARATGLSRTTIRNGIREIREELPELAAEISQSRVRKPGGGRKPLVQKDRKLLGDLQQLVEGSTRGDPQSPLTWTSKSTRRLAAELRQKGHEVSHVTVGKLLRELGYSLQANRKTREGKQHPDRDAQFEYLNRKTRSFQRRKQPVISVDTKKRELVGDFRNGGREWRPKGAPDCVRVHDFRDKDLGVAIPYGVYDVSENEGWISVGISRDTAEFAINTIHEWWRRMGQKVYPGATDLLIMADGGGSNSSRAKMWKVCVQWLSDKTGLKITVCHFPPGTSKWNKIEHRMFCHITENWRSRPLISHSVIVNLISHTTTTTGLRIKAKLDKRDYRTGVTVDDDTIMALNIRRHQFHGDWNYTVSPRK